MKALILNSGLGSRMGEASAERPKCLTPLPDGETILSRQLKQLAAEGIAHAVITTGPFEDQIRRTCAEAALPLKIDFVICLLPPVSSSLPMMHIRLPA